MEHPFDYDPLRFSLTAQAGFNDGAAFPFVLLGLGLLGLHDIGQFWLRWLLVDVLWAVGGGLAIGAVLGTTVARLMLYLHRVHREATGLDDFLAFGLIGISYGTALVCHTYGFLAVFAAGLALRRVERRHMLKTRMKNRPSPCPDRRTPTRQRIRKRRRPQWRRRCCTSTNKLSVSRSWPWWC